MLIIDRNTNMLDVAVQACGTINALFDIAILNGISITDDLVPGTSFEVNKIDYEFEPLAFKRPVAPKSAIAVQRSQTLIDFVTQHAGSVEAMFDFVFKNNLSITDELSLTTEYEVDQLKQDVSQFFEENKLFVSSSKVDEQLVLGGIAYMQIGTTFKVS